MAWDYKTMVNEHPVVHDRIVAVIAERSQQS
jgi:hypothetical protein